MDVLLRLVCHKGGKTMIVNDLEVDDELLNCPHCGAEIVVPGIDEDDDDE